MTKEENCIEAILIEIPPNNDNPEDPIEGFLKLFDITNKECAS
jgi:hypothetical protein